MLRLIFILLAGSLFYMSAAQINLSQFGEVSQSSVHTGNVTIYGPQNAINEPKSSLWVRGYPYCTHTAVNETYSWWKIEFPRRVYISSVDLFYRENFAQRMDGFRLSVTDDPSNILCSDVCYKDETDYTADISQTIGCNKVGKYLLYDKYLNDNAIREPFIELCYVGIYGCFLGSWGPNCSYSCPSSCYEGICYPESGICVRRHNENVTETMIGPVHVDKSPTASTIAM